MIQPGIFDFHKRLARIDKAGDPLLSLNKLVDWEQFRGIIEVSRRQKKRKSPAGAKGYDAVLMFKILILQALYNLSDEAMEFQILDRYSFSRFLGISEGDKVPDATTIFRFRDELAKQELLRLLFAQFETSLQEHGFRTQKGQIVDASIVRVPIQRNTRKENKSIKAGHEVKDWSTNKARQKDTDARWVKKNKMAFFGYKNHISIDVAHGFIRSYEVSPASLHDSQVFFELLDAENTSKDVWADSAYRSEASVQELKTQGFREHLQRKASKHKKLSPREKQGNRTRSRTRCRIEHVFAIQAMRTKGTLLRSIGIIRVRAKIGLRNLAYNLIRFVSLSTV